MKKKKNIKNIFIFILVILSILFIVYIVYNKMNNQTVVICEYKINAENKIKDEIYHKEEVTFSGNKMIHVKEMFIKDLNYITDEEERYDEYVNDETLDFRTDDDEHVKSNDSFEDGILYQKWEYDVEDVSTYLLRCGGLTVGSDDEDTYHISFKTESNDKAYNLYQYKESRKKEDYDCHTIRKFN